MTHKEVFKEFTSYFPDYAKNSEGMNNMRFETVKRYLKDEGVKNE